MIDRDGILEAYEEVRSDQNETNWCCLLYNENNEVYLESKGIDFEELKSKFGDGDRAYAFVRIETGDELSKRKKFALIVWVGPNTGALKKAKMSTEKAFVKQVFLNFATEMMFDDINDVTYEAIREETMRAGGANYGTGARD